MRRVLVLALVAPYALVMWPQWAARDLAAALCTAWRVRRAHSQEPGHRNTKTS